MAQKKAQKPSAPPLKIEQADSTNTKSVLEKSDKKVSSEKTDKLDFKTAHKSLLGFFEELFPGHANAALFGTIGFLVALLFFIIGFWKTLLIVVLVVIGVAIGQVYDGDPKIINVVKQFILNKNN